MAQQGLAVHPVSSGQRARVVCVKRLTLSDACTSKQIKLPKAAAEQLITPLADRESTSVLLVDEWKKEWPLMCTRYNCQYALSKIGSFISGNKIQPDDYLIFYFQGDDQLRVAVRRQLPSRLLDGTHVEVPSKSCVHLASSGGLSSQGSGTLGTNPRAAAGRRRAAPLQELPTSSFQAASTANISTGVHKSPLGIPGASQKFSASPAWQQAASRENISPHLMHGLRFPGHGGPSRTPPQGVLGALPPHPHLSPAQQHGLQALGQLGAALRLPTFPVLGHTPGEGRSPLVPFGHMPAASTQGTPTMMGSPLLSKLPGAVSLSEPPAVGPRGRVNSPVAGLVTSTNDSDTCIEGSMQAAVPAAEGTQHVLKSKSSDDSEEAGAAAAEALTMLSAGATERAATALGDGMGPDARLEAVEADAVEVKPAAPAVGKAAKKVKRIGASSLDAPCSTNDGRLPVHGVQPSYHANLQAMMQARSLLANPEIAKLHLAHNPLMAHALGLFNPLTPSPSWQQMVDSLAYQHMRLMEQLAAAAGNEARTSGAMPSAMKAAPALSSRIAQKRPRGSDADIAEALPRKSPAPQPVALILPEPSAPAPAACVFTDSPAADGAAPCASKVAGGAQGATFAGSNARPVAGTSCTPPPAVAPVSPVATSCVTPGRAQALKHGTEFGPTPVMQLLQQLGHELSDTLLCCKTLTEADLGDAVELPRAAPMAGSAADGRALSVDLRDVHTNSWRCTVLPREDSMQSSVMLHGLRDFLARERAAVGDMLRIGATSDAAEVGNASAARASFTTLGTAHSVRLLRRTDVAHVASAMGPLAHML